MAETRKVVLITGANKGIGFEVARQLGAAGYTVLVGARKEDLGRKAAAELQAQGADAHFILVDLDSRATADAAAAQIEGQFGKLDLLINNAAIATINDGPPSKVNPEDALKAMSTNYIGTLNVTQAMLPLVRKAESESGHARIINVSSELGSVSLHNDPNWEYAFAKFQAYCASKAALNMMSVQLAYELRDTGIKVNVVNPGYTATDLNGNSGHQTVEEGAVEIVRVAKAGDEVGTGTYTEARGNLPW